MLNVLPSIRLWRTRIICRLPIYRRSRKCRQYRPQAPSRRDNLTICALSLSKSRWRASARGWLSTQRSASAVHGIVAMSHRRRPKLPIVWGGASAAFGLAPEPVPRQNGAAWGAVVAVAGTGAVSEHHMTTTSQRPSMPARHSFQTGQHGSAVTSFFFSFFELAMQLRISLDFKEEPRSEATGLPDAGSRPRDVCSPMSTGGLQWMQLDGFGGGAALPQWLISG